MFTHEGLTLETPATIRFPWRLMHLYQLQLIKYSFTCTQTEDNASSYMDYFSIRLALTRQTNLTTWTGLAIRQVSQQ